MSGPLVIVAQSTRSAFRKAILSRFTSKFSISLFSIHFHSEKFPFSLNLLKFDRNRNLTGFRLKKAEKLGGRQQKQESYWRYLVAWCLFQSRDSISKFWYLGGQIAFPAGFFHVKIFNSVKSLRWPNCRFVDFAFISWKRAPYVQSLILVD